MEPVTLNISPSITTSWSNSTGTLPSSIIESQTGKTTEQLIRELGVILPKDMDDECVSICKTLNSLPGVTTYESCCGHGKAPFSVWFRCDNIGTLSRLGRTVNKNYSDGNWEIVLDSTDTNPRGCFWLRSKSVLPNDALLASLEKLEEYILYWFKEEFNEYFDKL